MDAKQQIYRASTRRASTQSSAPDTVEQLRDELARTQEHVAQSQRLAHIGSWELNLETRQLWWSAEVYRIFDLDPRTFAPSYEAFLDAIHPEDRARVRDAYTRSLTNHEPYDIVHRLQMRNGSITFVHERCETIYDAQGRPVHSLGTVQDISTQKRSETLRRDLDQASAQWTQAMDQFDVGICLLDPNRRVLRANRTFYAMVGADSRTAVGRHITDLVHPDGEDEPCLVCQAHNAQAEGIFVMEADDPANPTGRPVEVKLAHVLDDAGQVAFTLASVRDLSPARAIQERLRLSASVFENTHEGVIIVDAAMNVVEVNQAFSQISGYAREEAIGQRSGFWRSDRHDVGFYRDMWLTLGRDGLWRGEIWNRRKNGAVFPSWLTISRVEDERGELTHYVGVFSDITSAKRSQELLRHAANHDALTGLPNRLLLEERLGQAAKRATRRSRRFAVVFLDLDHFKHVNDSFGHPVGDQLLQQVAHRLVGTVREGDTVARIGGDEFVVLFDDIEGAEHAAVAAQKLIAALNVPVQLTPGDLNVNCSVGISLFPEDGTDPATLLRNADAAMYRTKEHGRNNYSFYTAELTQRSVERMTIERGLVRALADQTFRLHYQPQISLQTGRICGVEALLRWDHPELGSISPGRFIPVAEASGLIVPIGAWVLQAACAQAQRWLEEGVEFGVMAVNIAGQQIQRGELPSAVRQALASTGLPAERLELEVTETFVMTQARTAVTQLEELRALGIQLAIDDFGTGYSSLSHLKHLPFHKLKIDQSFVREIPGNSDDCAIASAIIALGRSLQLRVIAEGVETEAQGAFLAAAGCHEAQGYFYARPVPADEAKAFMQARHGAERQGADPQQTQ